MQPSSLNDYLIDCYLIPEQEMRAKLAPLISFIKNIDKASDSDVHSPKQWADTRKIAEVVIKQFQFLDNQTQQTLFDITECLAHQNPLLCYDIAIREEYQAIVQVWSHFAVLQKAVDNICLFLTTGSASHPLSEIEFNRSLNLITFAVKHFSSLDKEMQEQISYMGRLVKVVPLPKIQAKKNYQTLFQLFEKPLPPLSSPSPLPQVQPRIVIQNVEDLKNAVLTFCKTNPADDEDLVMTPPTSRKDLLLDKENLEKELKEKERIKTLQLEKISRLSANICRHYFPLSWLGTPLQQEQFLAGFQKRFPDVSKKVFFLPVARVSELEFQLLYQSLIQCTQFLSDINKEKSNSSTPPSENLHLHLTSALQSLFKHWQPESSPLNDFLAFVASNSSIQLIECLFHPDNLYFILERVLDSEHWDLEDHNPKKIPLEIFYTDDNVTTKLGDALENFTKEIITIGDPKWSANVGANALIKIIQVKKYVIAKKIQQALHQVKSDPCTMVPLLLIHRILFYKNESAFEPAWYKWQKYSLEEKNKIKQSIESKLNDYLYQIIHKEIDKQSSMFGWIVNQATSIKSFCQTLSLNLWQIVQKEDNIKLLSLHLLRGVEKALKS